jgi:hypothetical protein
VNLDFAEHVMRGGQDGREIEAAIEGRRLVEDVGDAARAGFDMDLVPALALSAAWMRSNSEAMSRHSLGESTFSMVTKPNSSRCLACSGVKSLSVTPSERRACLVYIGIPPKIRFLCGNLRRNV